MFTPPSIREQQERPFEGWGHEYTYVFKEVAARLQTRQLHDQSMKPQKRLEKGSTQLLLGISSSSGYWTAGGGPMKKSIKPTSLFDILINVAVAEERPG